MAGLEWPIQPSASNADGHCMGSFYNHIKICSLTKPSSALPELTYQVLTHSLTIVVVEFDKMRRMRRPSGGQNSDRFASPFPSDIPQTRSREGATFTPAKFLDVILRPLRDHCGTLHIGYMVYRLYGQFWLDKTVDHISDMHCNKVVSQLYCIVGQDRTNQQIRQFFLGAHKRTYRIRSNLQTE